MNKPISRKPDKTRNGVKPVFLFRLNSNTQTVQKSWAIPSGPFPYSTPDMIHLLPIHGQVMGSVK